MRWAYDRSALLARLLRRGGGLAQIIAQVFLLLREEFAALQPWQEIDLAVAASDQIVRPQSRLDASQERSTSPRIPRHWDHSFR